jgi:hypothetical protein
MTHIHHQQWHHCLAAYLQIKPGYAKALLQVGKLPDEKSCRNFSRPAFNDDLFLAAIARERKQFDTPIEPFVYDLHELIRQLRDGYAEAAAPNKRLVEFRFHDLGKFGGGAYPVDRHVRPWRGHRVAVSESELVAAQYPCFHMTFGPSSTLRTTADAAKDQIEEVFCNVPVGGEVQLGPLESYYRPACSDHLRQPLADFLERLTHVLEARALTDSAGDLPGGAP